MKDKLLIIRALILCTAAIFLCTILLKLFPEQKNIKDVPNSVLCIAIDEWIKNEDYRLLLKRKWIDGRTHEQIAEEFNLSVQRVKEIVSESKVIVITKL